LLVLRYTKHEITASKHEFGDPLLVLRYSKHEIAASKHEFGDPKHEFAAPKHELGDPKHEFDAPKHEFDASFGGQGQAPATPREVAAKTRRYHRQRPKALTFVF
jgi:hypothetical protein